MPRQSNIIFQKDCEMICTRRIVLCDLDHTLRNAFGRDVMIGVESWDTYHLAAKGEEPLHDVVNLVNCLVASGYTVVGLTAIPAKWRQLTMEWLAENKVNICDILMRPDDGFQPAPELKTKLAKERFGADNLHNVIAFILEDRDDVCMAFRDLGVTALQVHARSK